MPYPGSITSKPALKEGCGFDESSGARKARGFEQDSRVEGFGGARDPAGAGRVDRKNASSGKPALTARIAIDSGPVVVDASGEIFGDVPNIVAAARGRCKSV